MQETHIPRSRKHHPLYPEYVSWLHMRSRCNNKNNHKYYLYGKRGISVCGRWMHSFDNFFADMGKKPSTKHSLDRINVDGNYTPDNCRWASSAQQANNKTTNIKITLLGETHTLPEWAKITGINYLTLKQRVYYGWSDKDILTTPTYNGHMLTFMGKTQNIKKWANDTGINYRTIKSRIRYGWSTEKILTTPVNR